MTDTAVPAPAPTGDPAPTPTPTPAPTEWYAGVDADTKGWLDNKGYTKLDANAALQEAIKGYRHAETRLGVPANQLLRLPVDPTVPNSMDPVYNALGRPEKSDGYKFKDDADKEFVDWARDAFHRTGLTQSQSAKMYDEIEALTKAQEERVLEVSNTQKAADEADLQREWGTTFNRNMEMANAAAAAFGLDAEKMNGIAQSIGRKETVKLFQAIGAKIGEDTFVGGGGQRSDGIPTTPEGAQARIRQLEADKDWVKAYNNGDVEKRQLMTNLHKIMAAGKAA